jgi:hypothetical protein
LGERVDNTNSMKALKVPDPKAYIGEEDAEIFDRWLIGLLRWFWVNQYCRMELDKEHVVCMALYLEDVAVAWYDMTTWMA